MPLSARWELACSPQPSLKAFGNGAQGADLGIQRRRLECMGEERGPRLGSLGAVSQAGAGLGPGERGKFDSAHRNAIAMVGLRVDRCLGHDISGTNRMQQEWRALVGVSKHADMASDHAVDTPHRIARLKNSAALRQVVDAGAFKKSVKLGRGDRYHRELGGWRLGPVDV